MPRTKLGRQSKLEELLKPTQVEIPAELLESALLNALQPLYQRIAALETTQSQSIAVLSALMQQSQRQESALQQLLGVLQQSATGQPSHWLETKLQPALSQLQVISQQLHESVSTLTVLLSSIEID